MFHPVGTCAMGAVLEAELRVPGIECLRGVDASATATVPGDNTNTPTIMLAEKASDMFRGVRALGPRPQRWTPCEAPARRSADGGVGYGVRHGISAGGYDTPRWRAPAPP
jgi:choline dehydrogenase-like flavoprotein